MRNILQEKPLIYRVCIAVAHCFLMLSFLIRLRLHFMGIVSLSCMSNFPSYTQSS